MSDPFPPNVVDQAFRCSGGRCECTRSSHTGHPLGRCGVVLRADRRGSEQSGGWEAHHRDSNGPGTLSNCEILCQACHKATRFYGR
jgi:hypothetical protein